MKHLYKFNENNDEELSELNDLLTDIKDLDFTIKIDKTIPNDRVDGYIIITCTLKSGNYPIVEISQAFDELLTRLKRIYKEKLRSFLLKFEDAQVRIEFVIKGEEYQR